MRRQRESEKDSCVCVCGRVEMRASVECGGAARRTSRFNLVTCEGLNIVNGLTIIYAELLALPQAPTPWVMTLRETYTPRGHDPVEDRRIRGSGSFRKLNHSEVMMPAKTGASGGHDLTVN